VLLVINKFLIKIKRIYYLKNKFKKKSRLKGKQKIFLEKQEN